MPTMHNSEVRTKRQVMCPSGTTCRLLIQLASIIFLNPIKRVDSVQSKNYSL